MSRYRQVLYTTILLTFSCIFCLTGSTRLACAESPAPLNGHLSQLEFKPIQAPTHIMLTLDALDYFNQATTLKELKQAQAEPNLLPAVLSLFTYSSNDVLSHFGSPKVVIRSLSPVKMTFLFTFSFGEV